MEIIVKQFGSENHIYLFDAVKRPLTMEIMSKRKTRGYIKNLVKNHDIKDITVVNQIDFSEQPEYVIDRI
jgi:hypothetical protein